MHSFDDAAAIAAAPTVAPLDKCLRQLLADRVHDWTATGLLECTHLLVVQAGDTEESIKNKVVFSPLEDPVDGRRFGSKGFEPFWDWLEKHDGWFEFILTVGNSGFAFVLFIEDADGTEPALRKLCQTYAEVL
jgi:hypothetical protein